MKIAFVNPAILKSDKTWAAEPLPLITLAAYLQKYVKGVEVRIFDEQAGQDFKKGLLEFKPDVVGLTAMTMFANDAYRIADWVKENTDSLVAIGGIHATIMPEEAKQHADVVVKGEGELAFMDMANGKLKEGIVDYPIIKDLDSIPIPDRSLIDMEFYIKNISSKGKRIGRVLTSRGCPYKCIFCFNSKRIVPLRFNSAERVIEEIRGLVDEYDINYISFYDENFAMNKERLVKICNTIREEFGDLVWDCQTSSNIVDLQLLQIMKDAGCEQIGFGLESGSDKILKILGKGHVTVEQNEKAINLCKKAGIKVRGCFILGNYMETEEDLQKTVDFIERNEIDFVSLHILTPYPGTKLWDICLREKLIPENIDWSNFTTASESIPYANNMIPKERITNIYKTLWIKTAIKNYGYKEILRNLIRSPKTSVQFAIDIARHKLKI